MTLFTPFFSYFCLTLIDFGGSLLIGKLKNAGCKKQTAVMLFNADLTLHKTMVGTIRKAVVYL